VVTATVADVRTATYDAITATDPDERLTTGEAAKLLNSSRQHVVNLCDNGALPYTTIGSHRRVRRGDVEAIRTRTDRLSRDERRSLWLAYATASRIVQDPDTAVELGRTNLMKMRSTVRGTAVRWLDEWEKLLGGPVEELLAALTSSTPRGRELRQLSPFAGLLSDDERQRVLSAWRSRQLHA